MTAAQYAPAAAEESASPDALEVEKEFIFSNFGPEGSFSLHAKRSALEKFNAFKKIFQKSPHESNLALRDDSTKETFEKLIPYLECDTQDKKTEYLSHHCTLQEIHRFLSIANLLGLQEEYLLYIRQAAHAQKEKTSVHIEGKEPFELEITKSLLEKFDILNHSFDLFGGNKAFYLQSFFLENHFRRFIELLEKCNYYATHNLDTSSERFAQFFYGIERSYSNGWSFQEMLIFTNYANTLQLQEKLNFCISYNALHQLQSMSTEHLERLVQSGSLEDQGFMLSRLMKEILFSRLSLSANQDFFRKQHKEKLLILKKYGLLDCDITIHDLLANPRTEHLFIPFAAHLTGGKRTLTLRSHCLTSLEGIERIQGLEGIQVLFLDNNLLTTVDPLIALHLPNLECIWLDDNQITTLTPNTFAGAPLLNELYLRNNQLTTLDAKMLSGMQKLRKLFLENNKIDTIAPKAFRNLPKLFKLVLNNNLIETITPATFAHSPRLEELELARNPLKNKPAPRPHWPVTIAFLGTTACAYRALWDTPHEGESLPHAQIFAGASAAAFMALLYVLGDEPPTIKETIVKSLKRRNCHIKL